MKGIVKRGLRSGRLYEIIFVSVVGVSFLIWLIDIFSEGGYSSQFRLFFNSCGDFLADTLNVIGYSSERDPYHNMMYTGLGEKAYPPLTYAMMYLFSGLVDMDKYVLEDNFLKMYQETRFLTIYFIYAVIQMVMMYEFIRSCKKGNHLIKTGTAFALLLSAPMLYSFERGNTIILTVFFVGIYLFFYESDNKIMKELALISLAVAAAFKVTPAVLGILLLLNRQWKEAVRVVIYGVIIGIGPFVFMNGGFSNLIQMFRNMQQNLATYGSKDGCTLVAGVYAYLPDLDDTWIGLIKVVTYVLSAALMGSAFLCPKKWEVVMAVTMVLIILPSHSEYYCLLYLLPAILLFLNEKRHEPVDFLILIALLCILPAVQEHALSRLFNYHTGTLLIMIVLLGKGVWALSHKCRMIRRTQG